MNLTQKILLGIGIFLFINILNNILLRFLVFKKIHKGINQELNDVLTKDEYKVKGRFE